MLGTLAFAIGLKQPVGAVGDWCGTHILLVASGRRTINPDRRRRSCCLPVPPGSYTCSFRL